MDTITHGLLGATVAQLGFRQRIGRDATWVAAAAAVVPDLDILISPLLTLTGAEVNGFSVMSNHRGITHSLLVIPVMSLIVAGFWWWFRRKGESEEKGTPFWLLYLCVLFPMLAHPLLDWCTTYGTLLLAPLTRHRFAIDAVPIVDIIYTPILILTLLACFILRKLKPDARKLTLIVGWVGFGLSVGYLAAGYGLGRLALHEAREPMEKRFPCKGPCEYRAYPQLGTIFVWRVTRQCPDSWTAAKVNVLFGSEIDQAKMNYERKVDNFWIQRAKEFKELQIFDWFTMGQMRATYDHVDHRQVVEFYDMRYGARPESLESIWSVRATFNEASNEWTLEHVQPHRRGSLGQMARQALRDIGTP